MKIFTSRARLQLTSTFLMAGVLAGLSLLLSASFIRLDYVSTGQGHTESSSIYASLISLRTHGLRASTETRTENPASKQNRFKHPTAQPVDAPSKKLNLLMSKVRRLSLEGDAALFYSSFCLSRPQGRAPPPPLAA